MYLWLHIQFAINTEVSVSIYRYYIRRTDYTYDLSTPTQTDITIHFTSNHPLGHKLTAYNFYMLTIPITEEARQQEWNIICTIARNNGFPITDHP